MKQNKYDEAEFFAEYSKMPRSIYGLVAGMEWGAFRALLPGSEWAVPFLGRLDRR